MALFRIGCFFFTILTIESPRAFLSQRYSFESIDFIFALKARVVVRKDSFPIVQCQPVLSFTLKQRKETGAHSSLGKFVRE